MNLRLVTNNNPYDMRDDLDHLRTLARHHRVGPDGFLAATVTKVLAATEPHVTVKVGNSPGSLNFMCALVGPSGSGKGKTAAAVRDHVHIRDHKNRPIYTNEYNAGSGEGMSTVYRPRGTKDDEPNEVTRAVFSAPEIDSIGALQSRTGSTLTSVIRSAWSGEQLGNQNAGKDNSTRVPANSYRWCMWMGVQPRRAGVLLNDADGGTPQRVLWGEVGEPKDQAPLRAPANPQGDLNVTLPNLDGGCEMQVHHTIRDEYDAAEYERLIAPLDAGTLDGHLRFTRLRVAAALALMDGRKVVGKQDWDIAGAIVDRSTAVRQSILETLDAANKEHARNAAVARVDAKMAGDDHMETRAAQRVRDRILTSLEKHGECSRPELYRYCRQNLRPHFDAVFYSLIAQGVIHQVPGTEVYTCTDCTPAKNIV